MSDYFKDPRINASLLKCFAGRDYSPAVALQKWKGPKKQSKALSLGTLVHAFVEGLGELPDGVILKERDEDADGEGAFVLSPFDDFRAKDAKEWKASLPEGVTPIKRAELVQAEAMAKSLLSKVETPYADVLHDLKSKREVEFYTDDYKAKLDLLSKSGLMGIEIKTTRQTTWEGVKRDFDSMAYHLQCAFYADISGVETFSALIVSSVEPYPVFQAPCSPEYLEFGRWELKRALDRFQIWKDTEINSVPVQEETLEAPRWWKEERLKDL